MNFVLVHGAWHGGWCWRDVAAALRTAGHRVFTPTLTGLGERAHLLNPDVRLSTFIRDICAVIEAEELHEVVLVGHSFAGLVITGVADLMPQRLDQLVYLDALIVQSGQSALSILPLDVQTERSRTIDDEGLRMAIPSADKFGVFESEQVAWLTRQLTPHPINAYREALQLQHPFGNGLRKTYIAVTEPWYPPLQVLRDWIRTQGDWRWRELAAGHDAMLTSPAALTTMLMALAAEA